MTEHKCFSIDAYMENGIHGHCCCGWRTPTYRYRWIRETYGDLRRPKFWDMIVEQYTEAHKGLLNDSLC